MSVGLLVYLVAVYGRDNVAKFRAVPIIALIVSAGFFALTSTLYVTSLTLVSTATISVIGASSWYYGANATRRLNPAPIYQGV